MQSATTQLLVSPALMAIIHHQMKRNAIKIVQYRNAYPVPLKIHAQNVKMDIHYLKAVVAK